MSDHWCSVCHEDAEEDRMSWCGDRECCSPSYLLTCNCPGACVEFGEKPTQQPPATRTEGSNE